MEKPKLMFNEEHFDNIFFGIGLCLAISSSVFIGSSFIIKKIAIRKLCASGNIRASAGGFAYLRLWLWWLGFIMMGIGEAANLLAYAFAPAALVTPLGALSVLVATVLASRFLKENLNFIGKIGCFLCIIGSIVIIIHAPKSEEIKTFSELTVKLKDYLFIIYVVTISVICMTVKIFFIPRYAHSNVAIYLIMCSGFGSLTVVFCKAVALAVKETITKETNNFANWVFWLLFAAAVCSIMIQMNYLNKSLDIFNTSIVTPVYYVMFTVLVIMASGVLFREWEHMQFNDILGCLCGFLIVICAIFMLNAFKDLHVTLKDLNFVTKHRRDQSVNGETYIYGTTYNT